jgi:hypothetical protein
MCVASVDRASPLETSLRHDHPKELSVRISRFPPAVGLLIGPASALVAAIVSTGCSDSSHPASTPVEQAVAGRKESMKKFMQAKKAELDSQKRGKATRRGGPPG